MNAHRFNTFNGVLVVELEGLTQAFLSFERPMDPDDPEEDAKEVLILGMTNGPWADREDALAYNIHEAKRLLIDTSGYRDAT